MNIHTLTVNYISDQPILKEWTEAKSLIDHAASKRPRDWQLPALACKAFGGTEEDAVPACAALACAQISIILIDDMLDEDPRGEYHRLGAAQTSNLAGALLAAASQSVLRSSISVTKKITALQGLNSMITTLGYGQFLDTQNPIDEDSYWRIVRLKSGYFFQTALELGAIFGGATLNATSAIRKIGLLYGEMIQIHDDLGDCMTEPVSPDWTQSRSPLPILFAASVDHPDRVRFLELRKRAANPNALREAQNILIRCGAVSYCIDQLMSRYQRASTILDGIKLPEHNELERLLENIITPVRKLLGNV